MRFIAVSFLMGLGIGTPRQLTAQRLQPTSIPSFEPSQIPLQRSSALRALQQQRPSRGPYVLTGAVVGGVVSALTLGRVLVEAEAGSEPVLYGIAAGAGALLGAFVGLIVYEVGH